MPRRLFLFILLWQLVAILHSNGFAADNLEIFEPEVQSTLCATNPCQQEQTRFSPFDTVYLSLDFPNLEPGHHIVLTDWIRPDGSLERQNIHEFTLEFFTPAYQMFTWMQLWRNGPVKRLVTGCDVKKEYYGVWQVISRINGKLVDSRQFEMF